MGMGTLSVSGPPRPPPHGRAGLLRFRDSRGPRRMGEGASSALGPPRPPRHGRGDLLRFGTTEATATWALGPGGGVEGVAYHNRGDAPPPPRARFQIESP